MPRSKKLPIKRQKFVEALVGPANGNKTKAAEMAGYAMPESQGSRLSKFADVAQAIEGRLARATKAMDADEILEGLSQIARGKRASKVVVESGEALGKDGEPLMVQKTRREYDRRAGYETMARIRGMVKDGPPSTTPSVNVNVILPQIPTQTLDELTALMKAKSQALEIEARPV